MRYNLWLVYASIVFNRILIRYFLLIKQGHKLELDKFTHFKLLSR
jgi:hypothetical protein